MTVTDKRDVHTTKRVFKIPAQCRDFPMDDLSRALENLIFYPPENKGKNLLAKDFEEVQKRFTVTTHEEQLINQARQAFNLPSDKAAVQLALLWFVER